MDERAEQLVQSRSDASAVDVPAIHSTTARFEGRPSWRSLRAWCTLLIVFALGLGVDLWTKSWSFQTVAGHPVSLVYEEIVGNPGYRLPYHEGVKALPADLLDYRLVLNSGAVFGIGQNKRIVFVIFTLVAITVALSVFARWTRDKATVSHIAIGLILAGGVGNLYDRVMYGAVRDFLHIFPRWNLPFGWRWPGNATTEVFPWIFNIADVSLLAGMALLLIYVHRRDHLERKLKHTESMSTQSS